MNQKSMIDDEKSQSSGSGHEIDKGTTDNVGFKDYLRIFTYSDLLDWTFNAVGALASIASGASLAL